MIHIFLFQDYYKYTFGLKYLNLIFKLIHLNEAYAFLYNQIKLFYPKLGQFYSVLS